MKLLGFAGFDSTKGKPVDDPNANLSGVFKKSVRSARQYMNRRGGAPHTPRAAWTADAHSRVPQGSTVPCHPSGRDRNRRGHREFF